MVDEGRIDLFGDRRSSSRRSDASVGSSRRSGASEGSSRRSSASEGNSRVSGSSERSSRGHSRSHDQSRSNEGSSRSQSRSQSEESRNNSQSGHSRRDHGRSSSRDERSPRPSKVQRRLTPCNSQSQTSDSDESMPPIREDATVDNVSRSRKKSVQHKFVNDISSLLSDDREVLRPASRNLSQENSRRSSSSTRRNRETVQQVIATPSGLDVWDDMGNPNHGGPSAKRLPKPVSQGKGSQSVRGQTRAQGARWDNQRPGNNLAPQYNVPKPYQPVAVGPTIVQEPPVFFATVHAGPAASVTVKQPRASHREKNL